MKKKRSYLIIVCVVIFIGVLLGLPFIFPIKIKGVFTKYDYTVYKTSVELNAYKGKEKNVIIPQKIFFRKVNKIGEYCFLENNYVETVSIGDNIQTIGMDSFQECKNLKEIIMGKNVKEINEAAFSGCSSLQKINLPEGLEKIDDIAFDYCKSLKEITFPNSLKSIGNVAFRDSGIENVNLTSNIEYFGSNIYFNTPWEAKQVGCAVTTNGSLICYMGDSNKVIIPNNVKTVCAYFNEEKIDEIYFPDSVNEIRNNTVKCGKVTLYMPSSIEKIGDLDRNGGSISYTEDTTIVTTAGSYAEQYAKEQGFKCEIVDHIEYPTE